MKFEELTIHDERLTDRFISGEQTRAKYKLQTITTLYSHIHMSEIATNEARNGMTE